MVDQKRIENSLAEALAETYESLTFFQAVPGTLETGFDQGEKLFISRIAVNKPKEASLTMIASEHLMYMVVEELFGTSDGVEEQAFVDTLNEMTNTLAGQFLRTMNPELMFSLGLPTCEVTQAEFSVPEDWHMFEIEGQAAAIQYDPTFTEWDAEFNT